jgi:hypothetical protein
MCHVISTQILRHKKRRPFKGILSGVDKYGQAFILRVSEKPVQTVLMFFIKGVALLGFNTPPLGALLTQYRVEYTTEKAYTCPRDNGR